MSNQTHVTENKPDHHYRTEIPNIVFDLGLKPATFSLYCYYKRVAGDDNACWRSNAKIQKDMDMCAKSIAKHRAILATPMEALGGKSLITAAERFTEEGDPDTVLVGIVDVWRESGDFFRNKKSDKGTAKNAGGVPQKMREGTAKNAHKEEPLKKTPLKEEPSTASPSCCSHEIYELVKRLPITDPEKKSLLAVFYYIPDEPFKLAIEAYRQFADKRDLDCHIAVIRKALNEEWTPNADMAEKAAKEYQKRQVLIDKHEEIGALLATRCRIHGFRATNLGEYLEIKLDVWPIHQCFKYSDPSWKMQIDNVLLKVDTSLSAVLPRRKNA